MATTRRVVKLEVEQSTKKATKISLTLEDVDRTLSDGEALATGMVIGVRWGYPGTLSRPVGGIIHKVDPDEENGTVLVEAFGREVALSAGAWPVVAAAILCSIIAVFFYVRVIVLMFFLDADVQAAICAPREPIYDLSFGSSVVRPVAASLASYGAPRGGVSIYPTPRLSDISDGTGIWTRDDDADDAATKADCAVITCGSPEDYDIYGIYRCMTVTNMAAMTYPELVAAFLNRLQATQAQLGERTLLNAMRTDVNTIKVHSDGINVGMSIALLETLLRTIQSYKEQERYGDDIGFDCWLPRHVRTMLVVDQLRRKRTDNVSLGDIVSASKEITAAFTSAGVNPTWTYESASGWPTLSSLVNGSAIPQWPTTVKMLMTPTGNFRRLDGGELNLGVGGNTVRDTTSLSKNNFTMFWESFEGLVAFGARSLELTLVDVCPGGHQVADVTLDCETTQS